MREILEKTIRIPNDYNLNYHSRGVPTNLLDVLNVSECNITKLAFLLIFVILTLYAMTDGCTFFQLSQMIWQFYCDVFLQEENSVIFLSFSSFSKNKKILQQKRRRILFVYSGRPLTSIWFSTIGSFWRTDVGLIFFLLFFDIDLIVFFIVGGKLCKIYIQLAQLCVKR